MTRVHELSGEFKKTLEAENFDVVGHYTGVGHYTADAKYHTTHFCGNAGKRTWTLYSFVSFANGGKHIRFGICQTTLESRFNNSNMQKSLRLAFDLSWIKNNMQSWYVGVPDATPELLSTCGQFAGGTKPWEREEFIRYTEPYGGQGLIVARPSATTDDERRNLKKEETRLVIIYDPPADCNPSAPSAARRRRKWESTHGANQLSLG
jgi:hypothetical protein